MKKITEELINLNSNIMNERKTREDGEQAIFDSFFYIYYIFQ